MFHNRPMGPFFIWKHHIPVIRTCKIIPGASCHIDAREKGQAKLSFQKCLILEHFSLPKLGCVK